jgi:two-component system phosphate regulon sensor histidine kinase PhoR
LRTICAELVARPQPSTATFLEVAAAIDPSSAAWQNIFALHESTRAFHDVLRESDKSRLVFQNRSYVALSRPDRGGRWIVGLSAQALREACERAVASQTLPAHFRAEISVGEEKATRGGTLPIARVGGEVGSFHGALPFAVNVFLTDPQTFYAQQRARTVRIAALIVLSAAAVLIGFFAAWRSFRKQQQLNEMKTNFVSSVSHELRAPIASMRLLAEELEEGTQPTRTKLREYHHFIGQECRRLSALVENVLDFSRREQGRESFEFAPVDIEKIVRETTGIMEAYARERGVALFVHVEGDGHRRRADSGALQRLLVNLLDNAIKHSRQGSAVRTHLAFAPDRIVLSVADDGPGVAPEERSRIFERFYRVGSELRRETAGVGLGLAIVKHIAETHGGTVRVESEIGHGSRFVVELPLSALSEETPRAEIAVV